VTRTILLADDSSTVQRVIELTFAEEDIHVVTVGSGEQAIARLETDRPDIVLVDAAMPGKNGYEVASFIKHSPQLSHIPVLLLAGAAEPVDQRRAAEAGCDGVLEKPFEPELVIARVKELLARGVNVVSSQDDVDDPYYPFGKPDQLEVALMMAHTAQLTLPHELEQVLDMVTVNAARAARLPGYGMAPGCKADLVVLGAPSVREALRLQPHRRHVIKNGIEVARTTVREELRIP
jgi:CheY-like chemotaxis protein